MFLYNSVVALVKNINNIQLKTYKNTNLIGIPTSGVNSAKAEFYGPHLEKRDARLDITLSPSAYNMFLLELSEHQLEGAPFFANLFLGSGTSFLYPQWANTKLQIKNSLKQLSIEASLQEDTFFNLFSNWLINKKGFDAFLKVFRGQNLKNNFFPTPLAYSSIQFIQDMRQTGVVMQFNFLYDSSLAKYRVSNHCRAFPATAKAYSLVQYYYDDPTQMLQPTPPLIKIDVDSAGEDEMTVRQLLPLINSALQYNFNLSSEILSYKLVHVVIKEYNTNVKISDEDHKFIKNIKIGFFYQNGIATKLYDTKYIRLLAKKS